MLTLRNKSSHVGLRIRLLIVTTGVWLLGCCGLPTSHSVNCEMGGVNEIPAIGESRLSINLAQRGDRDGEAGSSMLSLGSVGYRWNPRDEADWKKALPFELLGPGSTSARVVDASGKVLIGSTDKRSLYELGVSPGLKRLVVSLGDGLSKVLEPESGLEIDLPATPPGRNMVGFSAWNWVSDDVLLSTSGVQALDEAGKPVSCCEGHNLEATHLYAFRISTRTLFPVRNPESLGSPLFTINRVSHDGFVELVTSETHSDAGNRSSWFRIK
jgi:hypothetical protein